MMMLRHINDMIMPGERSDYLFKDFYFFITCYIHSWEKSKLCNLVTTNKIKRMEQETDGRICYFTKQESDAKVKIHQ